MHNILEGFGESLIVVFEFAGGMILLANGGPQPLQYVANSAFLASLFADYLTASGVPGFYCGPNYITIDALRSFATSQVGLFTIRNQR